MKSILFGGIAAIALMASSAYAQVNVQTQDSTANSSVDATTSSGAAAGSVGNTTILEFGSAPIPDGSDRVPDIGGATLIYPNTVCYVSAAAGVGVAGFGGSLGIPIEDPECQERAWMNLLLMQCIQAGNQEACQVATYVMSTATDRLRAAYTAVRQQGSQAPVASQAPSVSAQPRPVATPQTPVQAASVTCPPGFGEPGGVENPADVPQACWAALAAANNGG